MNKFITKLSKLFLGISMAAGVGVAISSGRKASEPVAAAASYAFTGDTLEYSKQGLANNSTAYQTAFTNAADINTFQVQVGDGTNDGKYFDTGTGVRIYGGGHVKVTALNSKTLTKVVFTFSGSSYAAPSNNISGYTLSDATGTWTGSSSTISLTRASGSGHWRLQKVQATVSGGSTYTYSVSYNANGASESAPSSQSGTAASVTLSNTTLTKSGYVHIGWSTSDHLSNSSPDYTKGQTVTLSAVWTVTLYAHWKQVFTVTYSAGTNGEGEYAHSNQYGGAYQLLDFEDLDDISPSDGYMFDNYTVAGESKDPGDEITLGANTSVTVNFKAVPKVAVYSVSARDSVTSTGSAPTSSSMTYYNSYNASNGQMTSGNTSTWTLSGYTGKMITGITAYCRKSNSASGSITTATNNGVDIKSSLDKTSFSSSELTSSFKAFTVLGTDSDPIVINGDFVLIFTAAATSFYVNEVDISWDTAPVEEKEVVSISVTDNSGKSWYASDTLSASDLSVEVTYDTGNPVTITDGTGVYFDSNHTQTTYTLSQGTNSITVYYTDSFGSADNSEERLSITAGAARNLSSIAISTPPTKTIYEAGETFNASGMVVTASFTAGPTADVSSEVTISPDGALTVGTTSVTVSYTYKGTTRTATQAITVNAAPVVINVVGATESGKWHPTASGSTFTDSAGNTATLTTDTGHFGTSNPLQIGKNADAGTYVEVIIPLSAKAGIDAASATFKSNGASTSVTVFIYGDTDNDLIATGSVAGNSDLIKIETGNSYEKINAERIKYRFQFGGTGMFLSQLTYTLGTTVADFGTMVDLDILTPASNTQFKEGDTFSGAGIVLLATDDSEPAITKNLSSGLKFGTSQGDDSFTGHPFDATDAATGSFTVYVTATVGSVTMSVTYTITVTEVPTYSLVTDYSSLYEGAKVIVVAGTNAIGSFEPTYANSVEPVFTGDDVTDGNGATEFTVRIYGDKFGLQFGTYFLALNGDNNQLHHNLSLDDAGAWTKDETGIASPVEGRYLRYNSSKFTCDKSGTESELYISNKAPQTDSSAADTFTYRYLHMRDYLGTEGQPGSNYCKDTGDGAGKNYFSDAATAYAALSSEVKTEFKKNTEAVKRFQAWATANGKTIDLDSGTVSNASSRVMAILGFGSESSNTVAIIVIISMVSVTAIGGYFFLRKRKENN